jgi:hypothetical protein
MKIACIVMQKNEPLLLEAWIRYHSDLVGLENLFIFDNGSTCPSVIRLLEEAEGRGVNVFWEYSRVGDFHRKGALVADLIRRLDREDAFDFYFPLDCDEFLACQTGVGPSCRRRDVEEALRPLLLSDKTLTIKFKYLHNPCRKNRYSLWKGSRKCFFAHGACGSLDIGYHHGRSLSRSGEAVTDIVYFEFHYMPYHLQRKRCMQKLSGRLPGFSRRSLRAYAAKKGLSFHSAKQLLMGKYDYVRQFVGVENQLEMPELLAEFDRLEIDYAPFFEPEFFVSGAPQLFLLSLRQAVMHRFDSVMDVLHGVLSLLRRPLARVLKLPITALRRPAPPDRSAPPRRQAPGQGPTNQGPTSRGSTDHGSNRKRIH